MSAATSAEYKPLPQSTFFAYGFQEFALGFMTMLGTQYFAYFMTDVVYIAPALVATIMLIGRFADTLSVPVNGFIVQKTNFKWGKYCSWLFIASPLIVVFHLLMFSNLPVPELTKAIIMGASYILAYFFVNFCSTARFAILPLLTNDPQERNVLSTRRGQGQTIGQIVRGLVVIPIVTFLTGVTGSEVTGYFLLTLIFGVITIFGMYWLAILAKPYDTAAAAKSGGSPSVKDMLKQVATNRPLLFLVLAETFRQSANQVLVGFNMYYFSYVVGNMMMLSLYLPITWFGGFLGNTAAPTVTKKMDKKYTYMLGIGIWVLGMILAYLFSGSSAVAFIVFVMLAQFGQGLANAGSVAFFSDTSDYGEVKSGKNMRAVNMGLVIFPIKLGVLIGGSIASYGLVVAGFVAETTDPAVISNIQAMATLLPALTAILACLFMFLYPLNNKKMEEIRGQLKQMQARKA